MVVGMDKNEHEASTTPKPDDSGTDLGPDNDIYLELLAGMAERSARRDDVEKQFSLGITLTVRGILVSGTMVGRTRWFRELDETYGETLVGLTSSLRETNETLSERDADEIEEHRIHLINARHYPGGSPVPASGTFWRGQISSIDGWSLGTLAAD